MFCLYHSSGKCEFRPTECVNKTVNVCIALRVREVREAIPRTSSLREERPGLLRAALPPAVWQSLLRLQPGHRWRRLVLLEFMLIECPIMSTNELNMYNN